MGSTRREFTSEFKAEAAGLLSQVALRDVEVAEDDVAVRQGVARDRVVSHSDLEVRHGRKSAPRRFDGHRLDVRVDEACELVLGVDVRRATPATAMGAVPLLSQAARAAQQQPRTKALLRRRAEVEREIDHLQDLGMRKARDRGRRKTRLQALLAATVANFKRLSVLAMLGRPCLVAA